MHKNFGLKTLLAAILTLSMAVSLTACGSGGASTGSADNSEDTTNSSATDDADEAPATGSDLKADLIIANADATAQMMFDELGLIEKFNEQYPDISIELERYTESGDFENAMKIRASSNSLPDIMFFKPTAMGEFDQHLLPLDDLNAAKTSLYASDYAIDGVIKGIPEFASRELVYYWKDIFEEAGVEVPQTWNEFIDVSVAIKENLSDVVPIAMGAKDEWPDYPMNEYMPALVSGNGAYWNLMATQDEPFASDTDFYKAYRQIQDLYDKQVFGPDPQGIGWDQARAMFAQRQAGMLMCGMGTFSTIVQDAGDNLDGMGTFFLPVRTSEDEAFRTISQGDGFLSISADSKAPEAAKAFVEFYFSDAWYPEYIQAMAVSPTVEGVDVEFDPILMEAVDAQPDAEIVLYDGGNTDFTAIVGETKFDYKKLGVEMMASGFDLDARLAELNTAWKEARANLGIS